MMKSGKMEGEGQDGEATWQGRGRMGERHAGICLEPCTEAISVPWSSEGCSNCSWFQSVGYVCYCRLLCRALSDTCSIHCPDLLQL